MPDADARIPMLSVEQSLAAAQRAQLLPQMAELCVFRTLLHQPDVAKRVQDLLVTLLFQGKLDARLRELVILRIGWQSGSCYEWTQHWRVATELGIPEPDLLAVREWQGSDRLDAADRAALAATDDALATGAISAESWAACQEHVAGGPEALVELVAAIGTWSMISLVLRSLEVPLEAGVAAWPPDGRRPSGA